MKEKFKVSKDFILEAHKDACSTCKAKIENEFKELFPKVELEVGKWYKNVTRGYIFCFNGRNEDASQYGFNCCGEWSVNLSAHKRHSFELAAEEEVETALIAEAKKRGFKEGVAVFDCNGDKGVVRSRFFDEIVYFKDDNTLQSYDWSFKYNCVVFKDGKWAEIISEPIEVTLEQIAEKFGVEVEQIKIKK